MADLTNDDLRLYAHLMNEHLDDEGWAPIPVELVAIELKWPRQGVTESVDRLVAHGSLERQTANLMRGENVLDAGITIYRLT